MLPLVVLEVLEVGGQILAVPTMLHNFVNLDPLHGVWLEHSVYEVAHIPRDVIRQEEPPLTDFLK